MSDSPAPDPVATYIAEVRERAARLLPLNRKPSLLAEEVAQDVPRLLAVVEAVLEFHRPYTTGRPPYDRTGCGACLDSWGDEHEEWPCET